MTILQFIANQNALELASQAHIQDRIHSDVVSMPSEPVLRLVRSALADLEPFSPNDSLVLSRVLTRLREIEADKGVHVAIIRAKELVEIIQIQQSAHR
jgi:hypothetical protein